MNSKSFYYKTRWLNLFICIFCSLIGALALSHKEYFIGIVDLVLGLWNLYYYHTVSTSYNNALKEEQESTNETL